MTFAIWITDSNGQNGRWLSDSNNQKERWETESRFEAKCAAVERQRIYTNLQYEVKEIE